MDAILEAVILFVVSLLVPAAAGRSIQAGRNDPCPCGSGRKFKHCFISTHKPLGAPRETDPGDYGWRKMRRTEGEVMNALVSFARVRFGEDVANHAWLDFLQNKGIPKDGLRLDSIFTPWLAYDWIPSGSVACSKRRCEFSTSVALTYLAEKGKPVE